MLQNALDISILGFLVAGIFVGLRLMRKLDEFKSDRKAIDAMVTALNTASTRAEVAVRTMKETASETGDILQTKINGARALSDELEIMIEAADNLANRLSTVATSAPKPDQRASSLHDDDFDHQPRTRAERDLLDALRGKTKS